MNSNRFVKSTSVVGIQLVTILFLVNFLQKATHAEAATSPLERVCALLLDRIPLPALSTQSLIEASTAPTPNSRPWLFSDSRQLDRVSSLAPTLFHGRLIEELIRRRNPQAGFFENEIRKELAIGYGAEAPWYDRKLQLYLFAQRLKPGGSLNLIEREMIEAIIEAESTDKGHPAVLKVAQQLLHSQTLTDEDDINEAALGLIGKLMYEGAFRTSHAQRPEFVMHLREKIYIPDQVLSLVSLQLLIYLDGFTEVRRTVFEREFGQLGWDFRNFQDYESEPNEEDYEERKEAFFPKPTLKTSGADIRAARIKKEAFEAFFIARFKGEAQRKIYLPGYELSNHWHERELALTRYLQSIQRGEQHNSSIERLLNMATEYDEDERPQQLATLALSVVDEDGFSLEKVLQRIETRTAERDEERAIRSLFSNFDSLMGQSGRINNNRYSKQTRYPEGAVYLPPELYALVDLQLLILIDGFTPVRKKALEVLISLQRWEERAHTSHDQKATRFIEKMIEKYQN